MALPSSAGQALGDDERLYDGSRFADVRRAVFEHPYAELPVHRVTFRSVLRGLLSLRRRWQFLRAAERTVDSGADLRWDAATHGWRRILHPNGICLSGLWEITEKTDYTGYFRKGKRGLVIGRYSTCCTRTLRGQTRSLSLVGKIYPTTNPNHRRKLRTANFITQEDLGGTRTRFINDAELRNAPDTTAWRRGLDLPILLVTGLVFQKADRQPAHRQLYPVAELGKPAGTPTRAPEFMRLLVARDQFRIPGKRLDFRDEIRQQIYRRPGAAASDTLRFDIEVSDEGETRGLPVFERRRIRNWRKIGTITFDDAAASFNGDCVLHFNHPTWREHRDDPSSATRVDARKQR